MSLLNDMLRDLSSRRPVTDGAEGYDMRLLHSSSLSRTQSHSWIKISIFFVSVFVSVLAISYFMHTRSGVKKSTTIVAQHTVSSHTVTSHTVAPHKLIAASVVSTATISKSASVPISTQTAISISTPTIIDPIKTDEAIKDHTAAASAASIVVTNTSASELQNYINDLLQQAERAISMDRLTTPVEDNAYNYYQKILNMNANNTDAKEGLDNIASRYLTKAQELAKLGNLSQAEVFMQRARFVSERFMAAHEIDLNAINNQTVNPIDIQDTSAVVNNNLVIHNETSEASVRSEGPMRSEYSPHQVVTSSETIKPFVVAEAPVVSVQPNAIWKDEELAAYAQELIQKNKQAEALELLKKFVVKEKSPAHSAALLADVYLQQGNTQAAQIVIEQAHYLSADVKAKLQAQLFSANGNDAQAINLLEKNLTLAEANESYRSLLASLYHKTANYRQSIISYQRLISSFGEKPAYWLGLALAYDGLSQHNNALQAYQHLREYPQLQAPVKKYIDQRISALSRE